VAHPDVTDPERVIIRNQDNGRFVVGALFRRERENPGPSLQVSSDAAEELGMLAGSPSTLNVVALRREEIEVVPPATTDFDTPAEDLAAPAAISATPLDTPDVTPIAPAPITPAPAATSANGAAATVDAIAVAAAAVQTAESAAALPATSAALGAPLDARGPTADAATLPAPTAASSSLEKPFIQIGIFSVEANANETAGKLRADGMSASVVQQDSQGKTFWRVLVGPAPNAQDRTAILAKIQALGFSDAYFVTN
jgi:cell division septation protein DedD